MCIFHSTSDEKLSIKRKLCHRTETSLKPNWRIVNLLPHLHIKAKKYIPKYKVISPVTGSPWKLLDDHSNAIIAIFFQVLRETEHEKDWNFKVAPTDTDFQIKCVWTYRQMTKLYVLIVINLSFISSLLLCHVKINMTKTRLVCFIKQNAKQGDYKLWVT